MLPQVTGLSRMAALRRLSCIAVRLCCLPFLQSYSHHTPCGPRAPVSAGIAGRQPPSHVREGARRFPAGGPLLPLQP